MGPLQPCAANSKSEAALNGTITKSCPTDSDSKSTRTSYTYAKSSATLAPPEDVQAQANLASKDANKNPAIQGEHYNILVSTHCWELVSLFVNKAILLSHG